VPLCGYDETFCVLKSAVEGAKLGNADRLAASKRRDVQARARERLATGSTFNAGINEESARAHEYGRRSVNRAAKLCDR
jgi:uncharacterized protein